MAQTVKNQTTIWTIIITRILAVIWSDFRELMAQYPETIYAIDGVVLIVLRKLTVPNA